MKYKDWVYKKLLFGDMWAIIKLFTNFHISLPTYSGCDNNNYGPAKVWCATWYPLSVDIYLLYNSTLYLSLHMYIWIRIDFNKTKMKTILS